MCQVPIAHRVGNGLRLRRVSEVALHFRPDVQPLRIGNVQVDVIAAGVHRRQHNEQRLARIQGNPITVVRRTQRRQQPEASRHHQISKPTTKSTSNFTTQETPQESLPQDGQSKPTQLAELTIGGEHHPV